MDSRNGIPKIVLTVSLSTSKRYYKNKSPNYNYAIVNAVVLTVLPSANLTLILAQLLSFKLNFSQFSRHMKLLVGPLSTKHLHFYF